MKLMTAKLSIVFIGLIVISLIFTGVSYAKIDPKTCVAAWPFDEGQGDVTKDVSGNKNNGKLDGVKWVAGKFGKALEFDGAKSFVDCGANQVLNYTGTGKFSIVAWVKVLKNDADWHNIISKKVGYNNKDMGWMAWLDFRDQGAMQLRINDGAQTNDDTPTSSDKTLMAKIQDGNWHHLAWVISELGTVIYYLDGVLSGTNTYAMKGNTTSATTLRIGNSEGNSKGLNCQIDEVGIFTAVLAVEDIKSITSSGLGTSTGLTAVFPADKLAVSWGEVKSK